MVARRALTISWRLSSSDFTANDVARSCRLVWPRAGVPATMALSVSELQRIGYRRIALGGMVPLKTPEILACLRACNAGSRSRD